MFHLQRAVEINKAGLLEGNDKSSNIQTAKVLCTNNDCTFSCSFICKERWKTSL